MPIDSNVIYYGLLYLWETGRYSNGVSYIETNREELVDELGSQQYVSTLKYLFRLKSNQDISLKELYDFTANVSFNEYTMEEDKQLMFSVIAYIAGFRLVDYSSDSPLGNPMLKEIFEILRKNTIKPIEHNFITWVKLLKAWGVLSEEDKAEAKIECIDVLKRVFENTFCLDYLKIHLYGNRVKQ